MRYVLGLFIPALLQCLLIYFIIEVNTGNGSWLGLGAFLIGIFAVPATMIVNWVYIRNTQSTFQVKTIVRCLSIAAITPVIILFLFLMS